MRATLAWLAVAPVVAWTVVRGLGLDRGYPLVPLMAFTPFVAVGALAVTAFVALLRVRLAAVVAATCAVVLLAAVVPRALGGGGDAPAEGTELRVLTANLRRGQADPDAMVALARRADVLSLQEVDATAIRGLRAAGLGRIMPHAVVRLRARYAGTALFARRPLRAQPVPSGYGSAIAVARTGAVELWAVHPPAPLDESYVTRLSADLGRLPSADPSRVRVLAGDFNATLDFGALRSLIDRGYRDAADAVGAGLHFTWPAGRRLPPRVTIDHVLADRRVGVRSVSVHPLPGSDHRAVLARLVLPRR